MPTRAADVVYTPGAEALVSRAASSALRTRRTAFGRWGLRTRERQGGGSEQLEYATPRELIQAMDGRLTAGLEALERVGSIGPRLLEILKPICYPEEGAEITPENVMDRELTEAGMAMYVRDYNFGLAGWGQIIVESNVFTGTHESLVVVTAKNGYEAGLGSCVVRIQDTPLGLEMEIRMRGNGALEEKAWNDWFGSGVAQQVALGYFRNRAEKKVGDAKLSAVSYALELGGKVCFEAQATAGDFWSNGFEDLGKYTAFVSIELSSQDEMLVE